MAVLRLFLAEGADVAAIDKRGSSPLLIAIIVGHDGAARALLDAGADRVRLLREEGRDVSSQYGREGEGRGGGVKAGALAMGQHPRLGADSGARAVDPGVLRRILARLWQARASHLVVKF